MRKLSSYFFLLGFYFSFAACNNQPPEKYFGIAVLNCNQMHGFAGETLYRHLESPGVKMVDGNVNHTVPMTRKEMLDLTIESLESAYKNVKNLKQTEDSREMIQASLALYDFVLPVYKNEYQQLAKLFDEGAAKESIQSTAQSISDKYYPKFEQLYNQVMEKGKPYAEKHNINVNWNVRTSPQ